MSSNSRLFTNLAIGAASAVAFWASIQWGSPQSAPKPVPLEVTGAATPKSTGVADAATLQRGEYLARIGNCAHCHTVRGGEAYAGGRAIETPFGAVLSSNITPDKMFGIGQWSADDFWQALHHGQSRDGRLLYPAFPYTSYTRVSRADSDALFAFLQQVPAATRANEAHRLRWPYSTSAALWVWRSVNFKPAEGNASEDPMARGAYLVEGLGHCQECHSARDRWGGRTSEPQGNVLTEGRWYAPSLRTSAEAGVGAWSESDIVALLKTGVSPKGTALGPMAEVVLHGTQYLTDADAKAMAAYLRSMDTSNGNNTLGATATPATPATPAGAEVVAANGEKIYAKHCADCHGAQGEGRAPAYPALAGNRAVNLAQPNNLIHAVLHGGFPPATRGNPRPYGMPPLMLTLDDRQSAEVLTFIRSAWGNHAPTVSEFDINSLRR